MQRTFHGRGIEAAAGRQSAEPRGWRLRFPGRRTAGGALYRGLSRRERAGIRRDDAGRRDQFRLADRLRRIACARRVSKRAASDYLRGQVSAAGHGDRADGYVSLTGLNQDGFRDHAQQENYRLFGNAGFRFSDSVDGRLYVTHVDTRSQLPGNLTLAQANARPEAAAAGNLALDQRRDFRLDRIAGKLAWSPAQGQTLIVSAYYADKALHHPIFQVLQQDTQDAGVDLRWRSEGRIGGAATYWSRGIAFAQGDTEDDRFANMAGRSRRTHQQFDQRATNAKAYLENQTWLGEHWTLVAGAQH